jgi:hypothetical protein
VMKLGRNVHSGLRGVGYATRMLLPMYMTCRTLDFSHTIGCANSPWNTIFIYERYPLGLGFTQKAYDVLHEVMPGVLDHLKQCPCKDGCPVCVGKPLRGYTTWNVERGEASIPHKTAAIMILEGFLGDGSNLDNADTYALADTDAAEEARLEIALRRRLERMREPTVFHPLEPADAITTKYPDAEDRGTLEEADVSRRTTRRRSFEKDLRKRIAKKIPTAQLAPDAPAPHPGGGSVPPAAFSGKPSVSFEREPEAEMVAEAKRVRRALAPAEETGVAPVATTRDGASLAAATEQAPLATIQHGDSLAARARRMKKRKKAKD